MSAETTPEFSTLEELHNYLEAHALNFKYDHQIADLFIKLRDRLHEEKNEEEATKAQWEIDAFNFVFKQNELKPKFTSTNDQGEVVIYPNLKGFSKDTYTYLNQRSVSTSNPLLKARYSHLLWLSPKKHQKFAKAAIDSYLELIRLYEEKDRKDPSNHYGLDVLKSIENAYALSKCISYSSQDIATQIKHIVENYSFDSTSSFVLGFGLLK